MWVLEKEVYSLWCVYMCVCLQKMKPVAQKKENLVRNLLEDFMPEVSQGTSVSSF